MEMTIKTINAKRRVRIMIMGSVALLVAALCAPLFSAHAAGCSKSKGNPASSSTSGSTTSSSAISDFSSATLVCVSRSTAVSTLSSSARESGGSKYTSKKATICHIPPGNPANQHTLSVSTSAVSAHLDHGDSLGTCADAATIAYVESLPSCTTFDGGSTVSGVWLPDSAVGNASSMNAYVAQLQAGGLSAQPDSTSRSYREISGQ